MRVNVRLCVCYSLFFFLGGGHICILKSYSAYLKLYDTFIYYIPLYVYFQEYPNKRLTNVQLLFVIGYQFLRL